MAALVGDGVGLKLAASRIVDQVDQLPVAAVGLLGVVVGGLITFVVAFVQDQSAQSKAARDGRLAAAREVLGALQELNRRMIDIARIDSSDHEHRDWDELHLGTIRWNSARYAAALIAPTSETKLLQAVDQELDRVMEKALSRQWSSREFRPERVRLGELGADYLNLVRRNEDLPKSEIESLWPWAGPESRH